ncbi:hypothetical protein BDZ91DRAFT_824713 [Kalaharituber pfeilii]|nr:hypothetical protein BDZ91DRAFT_824713 [Kalaharituber pfeilii]
MLLPWLLHFVGVSSLEALLVPFVDAFKSTRLGNSEFPYEGYGEDDDGYDSYDDEEVDGVTLVSIGGLDRDEYIGEAGVERIDISRDGYEDDYLEGDAAEAEEAQVVEEQQIFDSRHTCTKNGYPCGTFPEGSQKELNIARTSSCTRNGIPCEEYVDGQDDDQTFTLNKSNDSYKTCTRNGMPCEEYESLAAAGKLPEVESQYQVSNGGKAPPGKE